MQASSAMSWLLQSCEEKLYRASDDLVEYPRDAASPCCPKCTIPACADGIEVLHELSLFDLLCAAWA